LIDTETLDLIEGVSRVVDLYGSWVSFHDAAVESVLIEREGPAVTIRFRTCDSVSKAGAPERDLRAYVTLRWQDVRDLCLAGIDWEENNWIDGLLIERHRDLLHTTLVKMDGIHGFLVAGRLEVVGVEPLLSSPGS
jgi:hypothetical protein